MKKYFDILLGVLAAVGGFLDLGQIVFALQIGAKFLYTQMWVLLLGTLAIIVYMEMSGRVAAVAKKPSFVVIKDWLGQKGGAFTLVVTTAVNLLTCAAEVGGTAIILKLLWGGSFTWEIVLAFVFIFLALLLLPFKAIERGFGLLGLCLVVFAAAAVYLHPNWHDVLRGLIPNSPHSSINHIFYYWFCAVALFSAVLLPYEVYLYSSGAMEDKWNEQHLTVNRITSIFGSVFGGLLTAALIILGTLLFTARGSQPQLPGAAVLGVTLAFGAKAVLLALLGLLFAISGAAVETALSGAYGIAQFVGWSWGKEKKLRQAPKFTITWMIIVIAAALIILLGVDPVKLVQYVVIISVIPLPLTYYPLLRAAADSQTMGKYKNGPWANSLGWIFFVITSIASAAAIPLLIITHGGRG